MTTATQLRRGGAGDGRCDVVEAPGDQAADVAADSAADNIGAQPDGILNHPLGLSVTLRAAASDECGLAGFRVPAPAWTNQVSCEDVRRRSDQQRNLVVSEIEALANRWR